MASYLAHTHTKKLIPKVLPIITRSRLLKTAKPIQESNTSIHCDCIKQDVYEINSADDFRQRVISSKIPVIVNFHAEWCEPCHGLKPLLEKYAQENKDKLHLAEISVDSHPELLQAFDVTAVPAVLAIQRGQVTDKFVGFTTNKEIDAFVQKLLQYSNEYDNPS